MTYPYMYGGWFLGVLLMVAVPLLLIVAVALIFAATRPSEDTALRIARERLARGEIDKEQLSVLLNAL